MIKPDFSGTEGRTAPFPHFMTSELVHPDSADALLRWLEQEAPWRLRIADFYEQNELSLLRGELPQAVAEFIAPTFIESIANELAERLDAPPLELVDVCTHLLEAGQTIRIHNDHLGGNEETHRLVVQLNRGWSIEQGGLLMLFSGDAPETVTDVILPVHRSAFGFEISERSHHAVSTIVTGSRISLVYTYRKAA